MAGLGMAAVGGELRSAGGSVAVHGLGELLATAPALLWDRIAGS